MRDTIGLDDFTTAIEDNTSQGIIMLTEHKQSQGIVFVDSMSRLLFLNHAAKTILASADGITVVDGELRPSDRIEATALKKIVSATAQLGSDRKHPSVLVITRPSCLKSYCLIVTSLQLALKGSPPSSGAIILIRDPERGAAPGIADLQRLYGMTPAEAAVALEIFHGSGLQFVATALGISRSTARTHLQRVFSKTGTHRQAELVRLVAETPVEITVDRLSPAATSAFRDARSLSSLQASVKQMTRRPNVTA